MRKLCTMRYALYAIPLVSFLLSGCIVRTYPVVRDRVDQELSGNRGYLQGKAPAEKSERKTTRTTRVVEIEMHPAITFEKSRKETTKETAMTERATDTEVMGNRGYMAESEPVEQMTQEAASGNLRYEQYTVKKGDTLQKISRKFYGTTKKWNSIFEANRDVLKGPDKIYSGQVIKVPVESAAAGKKIK